VGSRDRTSVSLASLRPEERCCRVRRYPVFRPIEAEEGSP
jgi:hypothetical protein